MLPVIIGLAFAAPVVINIANRVLVEELIPRKDKKRIVERIEEKGVEEEPRVVPMDMALTPSELNKLSQIGAIEILVRGAGRLKDILDAGEVDIPLCTHCNRLH